MTETATNTATAKAPPKPAPKPTPSPTARPALPGPLGGATAQPAQPASPVSFGPISRGGGHRIMLYGPGGIGKTTLAAHMPGPIGFIDLDESLPRLRVNLEESGLAEGVRSVNGVNTWGELRKALRSEGWNEIKTIVIDSVTLAEEFAVKDVLDKVPRDDKGGKAVRIEDYGYGKGYQHIYETFIALLADLDRHCRAGRHVCLIAHDCVTTVPNPNGDDYIRYEPRLQSPGSGKGSIRHRVKEWADHVLFYGYNIEVDKQSKGKVSGVRTLWPNETALCMAKSRTCATPLIVEADNGAAVWAEFLK